MDKNNTLEEQLELPLDLFLEPEESTDDGDSKSGSFIGDFWITDDLRHADKEKQNNLNKNFCSHSWKKYEGLFEAFEFCEYCDKKRDHEK